jgi:ribosomal protein S18 acetylase RimI-like enzyme
MRKANRQDISVITSILTDAFIDNKSVNYVVKQDKHKRRRIAGLMKYSFKVCQAFGEVWISDDKQACALLLFPDKKKTTLSGVLQDVDLAFSVIGITRVADVMKREALIKNHHPKEPFCHLWFIGVDIQHQHNGKGSEFLQSLIDLCRKRNQSIYLETSVERNINWYKKFGFEIYETIDLSYRLYLLRKLITSQT